MAEEIKCPHCGKPVPPGTPGGLCPECMVKVGIGSEAGTAAAGSKRPAPAPPSPEAIARHFPQLEIIELLGSGGMGAVYKARQREIDRLVALKILPSEAAGDPGFAERFTREARALARLNHPNIVALYHFGHVNGLHYFIMEYVDGLNLRQLEQAGRLSPREALQIIPQICEALQFAHDEGIVHRDIKPENVLLDKKGRVKIADFGLARILGHEPEDFRLTRAREVMGTPHYMAPEQVEKPQSVDHRADIYSLGVVFYEMLTGELPLGKFLPPSQKVQIDVRLDDIVLRALEKEPGRRYQHASEVKTDMETIMTKPPAGTADTASALPGSGVRPAQSWRRSIVPVAAGLLVLLAIGLAWVWKKGHAFGPSKPGTASLSPGTNANPAVAGTPVEGGRWYYVSGEIRSPGRHAYDSRITLLQAITSAGDFTDFADKERVKLTSADGHSQIVNCLKALDDPSLDLGLQPGDTIYVPRRAEYGAGPTSASPGTNAGVADAAEREVFARLLARRRAELGAGPTAPSPGTNANMADAAEREVLARLLARRYGIAPPTSRPKAPETPEQAFARRYGLRPSAPVPPSNAPASFPAAANGTAPLSYQWNFATNGNPEVTTPDSPSNVNFRVVATGTNPLSYQWYHAPHDTTGVTNPGPEGLILTRLAPLYLKLSLDGVAPILGSVRYLISVENEAAASPPRRLKRVYHCSLRPNASFSSSNEVFTLREVKGSADNPTPILELNDTKERVSLSLGHPYQGVEGYAADLRYGPESKTWALRRVGEVLSFGGDEYEIIAITQTAVVLRQISNNKTWAVEYEGGAATQP
jgi:serine/threonine protein kinase